MRNLSLAAMVFVATAAWSPRVNAEPLKYIGCSVVRLSFMAKMIDVYQKKSGITVEAADGGDTAAIKAVVEQPDRFGGVCRELYKSADEEDLRLVLIGWGALVVVVNAKNPVKAITMDQVRKIFDGKIGNWKELGGKDAEIHPIVRKPGKLSGVGYSSKLLVYHDLDHAYGPKVKIMQATAGVEEEVATDEAGVGFSDVMSAKKNPGLAVVPLENVVPDKASIATGRYSLFRPLFLVLHKDHAKQNPQIQRFVDFVLSPEGQKIVSQEGMVNLEQGAGLKAKYPWVNAEAVVNLSK